MALHGKGLVRQCMARLYRMLIPARPVHLAVLGGAAIVANLLGILSAEAAMQAALAPLIILLVITIARDIIWPPPYAPSRC